MSTYKEMTHCALCGKPASEASIVLKINSEQNLLRCVDCGLVFNDLCRTDIESIYGEEYFQTSEKKSPGGYFSYDGMDKAIVRTYRFASDVIFEQCRKTEDNVALLELGCGYGFFLKQFGGTANIDVIGVEVSRRAADEASRFIDRIVRESAESVDLPGEFDFVAAFELIEHLPDPAGLFRKVHGFLKDGGYFFITTPDIGSFWFKMLKRRWPGIHPDYHNVYFCKSTICRMAKECDFEVESIRSKQYYHTNIRHVRMRLRELFPFLGPFLVFLRPFDSLTIPFLNGGDLQMILRKKGTM